MIRSAILLIFIALSSLTLAQPIYAVWEDQNANTYYFVSLDAGTAVKTNVASIAGMSGIIAPNNTVIDADSNWYIVRALMGSQYRLLTIDISTGAVLNNVLFPGTFVGFELNESNDSIYCLYHDNNTSYNLARVDPVTGNYNLFPAIPNVQAYVGETFTLDQNDGYYSFRASTNLGYRLLTLDITDGSVAYDNALLVNFTGHEYNCQNDSIYGLYQDNSTNDYYLMTMDNTTAQLTVVDTLDDVDGYASYTASLDAWNGTYSFYGFDGSASKLFQVDVADGSVISSANISNNAAGWEGYETCTPPPAPIAEFESDTQLIAAGDSVNFTDLSLFSPTQWSWSFPGGQPTTSNAQHPNDIVYDSAGCYDVTLIVANSSGSDTLTKVCYIEVIEPPVADFVADTVHLAMGDSVHFTDLSLNNPTAWDWTFDQGNPATSTLQHPSVEYPFPGNFSVTLTAVNQAGADTMVKVQYIHVYDVPIADFATDDTLIYQGDTAHFVDYSGINITHWEWTFPGGSPSSSTQPVPPDVIYNTPGCYDVSLKVSNPVGADSLTFTCYIKVLSLAVEADFVGDSLLIEAGENVDFTDLSSNVPTSWNWTFQGGTPGSSTVQHPLDIVYDTPGCYDVSLHAQNAWGGDTAIKVCYITVTEPETPEGVHEFANSSITIRPNPASESFRIILNDAKPMQWQLIDLQGTVVRNGVSNGQTTVNVNDLASGYYMIRCEINGNTLHRPVVIRN